jgi:glycolate oxidase
LYNKISSNIISLLSSIYGKDCIIHNDDISLSSYASDESYLQSVLPEIVVFPETTQQIKETVKIANQEKIPVTVRGGGSGVTGAAIPIHHGILISTKKMNHILEIDEENLTVTTEPGIILENLHKAVETKNLFYPPDPNSLDTCSIGGNLATSAGGPRCIKYGITRDYVVGTKAVMANGEIIKFGGKFNKISTGYNLNHLLIGSEGTLGIITEIILQLIPKPLYTIDMLVPFDKIENASKLVPKLLKMDFKPAIIEYIDKKSIQYSEKFLDKKFQYSDEAEAQLLIEIDGFNKDVLDDTVEKFGELLLENGAIDVFIAEQQKEKDKIWEMRRTLREAIKHIGKEKFGEDVVVPPSKIPEILSECKKLSKKLGIDIISYGHIGDGNVHINVVKNNLTDSEWQKKSAEAIKNIFEISVKLGGTISGEHGIGLTKKKYLNMVLTDKEINLMKTIKKNFDVNNIMNPGKIFS